MTLTATATADIRETIVTDFSMIDCEYVTVDCNRINIRYSVMSVVNDIEVNFTWLVEMLRKKGIMSDRIIVFCQSRKQCTELYSFFKQQLGPESYHFEVDDQRKSNPKCLFGMYHLTTLEKQKQTVEDSFRKADGAMRVLFCTSSFGMGVDVKGCYTCIHYGPSASVEDYLQQSGRIGRDGKASHSIVLTYKRCFNTIHVSEDMKSFCNALSCRRAVLMRTINNYSCTLPIKHACCDLCSNICDCRCNCDKESKLCTCTESCRNDIVSSKAECFIAQSNVQHNVLFSSMGDIKNL